MHQLSALKLTGDLNVPAGQTSFVCNLPIATTAAAATNSCSSDAGHSDLCSDRNCGRCLFAGSEPFVLPSGIDSRVELDVRIISQLRVRCRMKGWGHIAAPGHRDEIWVPITVLVFSPGCLGVLWHSIRSFSMLSRLQL